MDQDEVGLNGWTSVPADAGVIFDHHSLINEPEYIPMDAIEFPFNHPVVSKTLDYVKQVLHPETFNHSMRVYYYGMAITKQHFPQQATVLSPVTWALTCLLHDLGTAEENLRATRMSFDIFGGIKALQTLKDFGASSDQAEAVTEAIIRHQDMGVDGSITFIGQLIQLATTYDNTSIHPHVKNFEKIVNSRTREEINKAHIRLAWSKFFSGTIQTEETFKPWCHSTHLVDFAEEIRNNSLMKQFE
ncbi:hypothetical protein PISL3812_08965 [Talaromyces islandicus]|uniref:HD domain-containing protein n=1 Tax=Talaromyces islandicus TaxID=28573 RepID=A0A0U1MA35_TALIS|nr:hypothetical protein PISL3812_08965 [Talaromyces islandicus]